MTEPNRYAIASAAKTLSNSSTALTLFSHLLRRRPAAGPSAATVPITQPCPREAV